MSRLRSKIAIVTGGAHGIGKAISELFAEEGATVLVVDIDVEAGQITTSEISRKGGSAIFAAADVSSREEAARAVRIAADKNGRIDVLCNNAAYLADWHNVAEAGDEEWQKCFSVS